MHINESKENDGTDSLTRAEFVNLPPQFPNLPLDPAAAFVSVDTSTSLVQRTMGCLDAQLSCKECKAALDKRVKEVVRKWTILEVGYPRGRRARDEL